jgi:hypothetical protein
VRIFFVLLSIVVQACGHRIHAWPEINFVLQTQRFSSGAPSMPQGKHFTVLAELRWGEYFHEEISDLELDPTFATELQ